MAQPQLLLYSRQGCCLCEGLEERLRALPGVTGLDVIDVDGDPGLQQRYGLEVQRFARTPTATRRLRPQGRARKRAKKAGEAVLRLVAK